MKQFLIKFLMLLSAFQKFFEIEEEKAAMQDEANSRMSFLAKKLKEKEEILKDLRNELEQYEESGIQKVVSLIPFYNKL